MYNKGSLAATGTGLVIFGQQVSFSLALAAAVVLVLSGSLLYRFGTRGNKYHG
jgi:hypothetical protein